jgi:L-rhamnose mutarotase
MAEKQVIRIGQVIRVKPEKLEEYKKLHANAREGVLKTIYDWSGKQYYPYAGCLSYFWD